MTALAGNLYSFRRRQSLQVIHSVKAYLFDLHGLNNLVCNLQVKCKWSNNTELDMDLFRCLLASLLLTFSGQSMALFMPDGFTVNSEAAGESDGGCGSISTDLREHGES